MPERERDGGRAGGRERASGRERDKVYNVDREIDTDAGSLRYISISIYISNCNVKIVCIRNWEWYKAKNQPRKRYFSFPDLFQIGYPLVYYIKYKIYDEQDVHSVIIL